jgi:hypothetical protein
MNVKVLTSVAAAATILGSAVPCFADTIAVEPFLTIPASGAANTGFLAGESQSTIVPPGTKPQCPNGRILATMDWLRPKTIPDSSGIVRGQDLTASNPFNMAVNVVRKTVLSYFMTAAPDQQYLSFAGNDNDLLTLPNGDVLYLIGAVSTKPLVPQPTWFDVSYYGYNGAGPGARGDIETWLSTDCGNTFSWVSELDPATTGGGGCAVPQQLMTPPPKHATNQPSQQFTHSEYAMGGTDGPLAKVDPATGKVYITFQCEGYAVLPLPPFHNGTERAGGGTPLNTTLVAEWDEGTNLSPPPTTWTFLGYLPLGRWRFGIVPLNGGQTNQELVFAETNVLIPAPFSNGTYDLTATTQFPTVPTGEAVWWNLPKFSMQTSYVWWNFAASTVAAQAGNGIVLAYPNEISRPGPTPFPLKSPTAAPSPYRTPGPTKTFVPKPSFGGYFPSATIDNFGYRVYYFDLASQSFSAIPPVLPMNLAATYADGLMLGTSIVMHLVIVPVGDATLLYWTDMDFASGIGQARGRFIFGRGQYSSDFAIAQNGPSGQPHTFAIPDPQNSPSFYWYGDYQTAAGYETKGPTSSTYNAYPIWIEPDGTIHYAHVAYTKPNTQ